MFNPTGHKVPFTPMQRRQSLSHQTSEAPPSPVHSGNLHQYATSNVANSPSVWHAQQASIFMQQAVFSVTIPGTRALPQSTSPNPQTQPSLNLMQAPPSLVTVAPAPLVYPGSSWPTQETPCPFTFDQPSPFQQRPFPLTFDQVLPTRQTPYPSTFGHPSNPYPVAFMAPTPTRASPSNESPQSTNAFAPSPTTPTPAPRPTSSTVTTVSASTQARLLRSQRPAPYLPPHAAASTAAANQARPLNRQLFTPEQPFVANNTSSFQQNTTINTAVNNIAHRPDSNYAAWPPLEVLILFNFVNGLPIMPLEHPMMQELLGPGPLDERVRVEHELRVVALEQWMGALMAGRTVNDGGQLWRAVRDTFGENEFDRL